MEWPAPDNDFDVLRLVECSLHDHFMLMELGRVVAKEQAEAESRLGEICRLKDRIRVAEKE